MSALHTVPLYENLYLQRDTGWFDPVWMNSTGIIRNLDWGTSTIIVSSIWVLFESPVVTQR